ncbi:hypothetical protein ABIA39_008605 [Nocardia sp. GAS34]|uniref:hypothetical protein n=1 Tax=unclassified Nocardia TaxID=2637762 RepID=UPI003D23CF93
MIDARSQWSHTQLTSEFLAESCCFADMTGDGREDLVAGDRWWTLDPPHTATVFRTVADAWLPPWGGGNRPDPHAHLRESSSLPPQYKAATYDWPIGSHGGVPDALLSVGMHRDPVRWFAHRSGAQAWDIRPVTSGGTYESAVYADLDTAGTRGLVTVPYRPSIAWYEPGDDPHAPWIEHAVGPRGGNWHGLGVGVVDDDRPHILTPTGIYAPREDIRAPWRWSPLRQIDEHGTLSDGLGDVHLIHTRRLGHGSASLFAASPHGRGLWRWDPVETTTTGRVYQRSTLEAATSQLHAVAVLPAAAGEPVDAWVITGKRWHAHGPDHDIDPNGTPVLFRIGVHVDPHEPVQAELICDHSGVGMNFAARRLGDGRMQIATANKRGVHLFTQTRTPEMKETPHGK